MIHFFFSLSFFFPFSFCPIRTYEPASSPKGLVKTGAFRSGLNMRSLGPGGMFLSDTLPEHTPKPGSHRASSPAQPHGKLSSTGAAYSPAKSSRRHDERPRSQLGKFQMKKHEREREIYRIKYEK